VFAVIPENLELGDLTFDVTEINLRCLSYVNLSNLLIESTKELEKKYQVLEARIVELEKKNQP
jgi:uncharacterized protein YbbC (DUF1343 family)